MRRHFRWDKKYLYWGVTAFLVIAAAILFLMTLLNLPWVRATLSGIGKILSPFIWGFVITYLIAPLMKLLERRVFGPLSALLFRKSKTKDGRKLARALSVTFSVLILVAILVGIVYMMVPSLIDSIRTIIQNWDLYYQTVTGYIAQFQVKHPDVYEVVGQTLNKITGDINSWGESLLPKAVEYLTSFLEGTWGVLLGVYNLIIGIIVSIYVLFDLEKFTAAARRWIYSVFSVENAERVREAIAFTDRTFMGFITGKLLDSAIIGLICYIVCAILNMPYALLVSVMVGVTNIIPFFGPFIGAVPSAIVILMVSPVKCLIFIIFVIILQQVDGNIIGPKILGSSVGINGFWVMFSIILGAGLFSFWGMLLGVPVFVVIYTGITSLVEKKLKKRSLPVEPAAYSDLDHIDPVTRLPVKKTEIDDDGEDILPPKKEADT